MGKVSCLYVNTYSYRGTQKYISFYKLQGLTHEYISQMTDSES